MNQEHPLVRDYLDGELAYDALPEEHRPEADQFRRIADAMASDRVALPPGVRAAIMRRVRAAPEPAARRVWSWVMTPREIRVSPAMGVLALAAAVGALLLTRPRAGTVPDAGPSHAALTATNTRFVFLAPTASSVAVTGDFASWDPKGIPLRDATGTGVWVVELTLPAGLHHYVFVVDGHQWLPDPNASQVDDGFGQKNSVLMVPARVES
ncbi:MAG: hypothetical protein HYT81_09765 [Gemmatimonadetes bacterium]|nr:hypothetical protein [Gemmatimonadota bacterium]MBI2401339.1 hypothetical protein [Gemmatimonadota bacterium]